MSESTEVIRLTTAAQLKGLAHPTRERLMMHLSEHPVTISHLARVLGVAKGTVAYHLNVLRTAGLVKVVKQRTVRGGTEQHYRVAAPTIMYPDELGRPPAGPIFGAVAADVDAAEEVPVQYHHAIHLNAADAERVVAALREVDEILRRVPDRGPDVQRYGIMVSCYRYPSPDPE